MFQGSMVALVTPMLENGEVDNATLEQLVEFHVTEGTDAIVAVGTTGESATLSHQEHCDVVKQVVSFSNSRVPIVAGTGSNSTLEALALTKSAKKAGADAALLVTPYYNKPTQEGLFQHYKMIAEKVDLPQLLYNVPGRTACDLLPETVQGLSLVDNIIGIKEATGNIERAKWLIEHCYDEFDILSGDDATAMEFILAGGHGNISVTANVLPKIMHDMCAAALKGDRDGATILNDVMTELNHLLFTEANPIPVKYAIHKMGFGSNTMRLPLTIHAKHYQARLLDAMKKTGVIIKDK